MITKLAKETGRSVESLEKKWEEAKSIAEQEGITEKKDYFFAYVTKIFKNLTGTEGKKMSESILSFKEYILGEETTSADVAQVSSKIGSVEKRPKFKFIIDGKYLDFVDKYEALQAAKFLDTKKIRSDELDINRGILEFENEERAKEVAKILKSEDINESSDSTYTIHELHPDDNNRYSNSITVSREQLNDINKQVKELVKNKKIHPADYSYEGNNTYEASTEVFSLLKLYDINESLNRAQKDKLKAMFNTSINKFDDSMSVKDFAAVIAEIFYEEYGQHNYSAFMNTWNNIKAQHLDDLEESKNQ